MSLALVLTGAISGGAHAQEAPVIGGDPQPCVIVDIAGSRAGHLDCASQRLREAARVAQAKARGAIEATIVTAGASDIRTGVASQSATRQRLGTNFGTAVRPQRPAAAWSNSLGPRR